jgi:hypothetical protein
MTIPQEELLSVKSLPKKSALMDTVQMLELPQGWSKGS